MNMQLHIFAGFDLSRSGDFERQLNDIKVKNMVPDIQIIQPWNSYIEICSIYKVINNDFINYRQLLFLHCGIPSDVCKTCTNCRKNHAMSDAAIQARAKQDEIESNKEYVRQQLTKMKD